MNYEIRDLTFFSAGDDNTRYHELCLYFLMDIADTDLLSRGNTFTLREGTRLHTFEWLKFETLDKLNFKPIS